MLMAAALRTGVADPVERLLRTHASLGDMKQRHRALPASLLADANHCIAPAVFSRAARLRFGIATSRPGRPVWNLVISNVPRPQFALYCAGAKLVANYPVSVITHGRGLNITVIAHGQPRPRHLRRPRADARFGPDGLAARGARSC